MKYLSLIRFPVARRTTLVSRMLLIATVVSLFATLGSAQQTYVGRYDAYVGYAYLDSPHVSLGENGVHTQVGYRVKSWLSLGFDFSDSSGSLTLTPNLLTTALQQTLGAQLVGLVQKGVIPPTYSLTVPVSSTTQTYAAGPQVSYHHFKAVTLFLRPDLGLIHEVATPKGGLDPVATAIVAQLAPSGKKIDKTVFYGFGGGVDVNLGQHFCIRVQADLVHDHLFKDLLKDSRNTVRFSIGPGIQWGKNVVQ